MVHHPQAREAGLLGGAARSRRAWPRSSGCPGKPKREICRPKSSVMGSSCWRAAASSAVEERGRARARPARRDGRRRSPRRRGRPRRPAASRSCALTTLLGTGPLARAVALAHDPLAGVSNTTAWAGTPWRSASARQAARRPASSPVESITVVSRRAHPLGDDQVEHLERVAARALVALAGADDRAQPVRGDDLVGVEPLARPVRLAGGGGADEHDEARVGEPHAAVVPHSHAARSRTTLSHRLRDRQREDPEGRRQAPAAGRGAPQGRREGRPGRPGRHQVGRGGLARDPAGRRGPRRGRDRRRERRDRRGQGQRERAR